MERRERLALALLLMDRYLRRLESEFGPVEELEQLGFAIDVIGQQLEECTLEPHSEDIKAAQALFKDFAASELPTIPTEVAIQYAALLRAQHREALAAKFDALPHPGTNTAAAVIRRFGPNL